ncbi:MAG: IPT/TIG domain-containing protein [Streptomyces sp.]
MLAVLAILAAATALLVAVPQAAQAVTNISVSSTTVAAGDTFTVTFSGTADSARTDAGENFYGSSSSGPLPDFTTIEACTGNTAPCTAFFGIGQRVPLGNLAAGAAFSGSITLRINPSTPAGTFVLGYQLTNGGGSGEATVYNPTITITNAPPAPAVTAVSPASGTTAGGTPVTVTGTNLSGATGITFGANPATGITCTATSCTATTPAGAAGTVDVRVTTPAGTSPNTGADDYTYVAPADVGVNVTGQPHLGILVPYLAYTLSAHNNGPGAVTSATITASLPAGASATNLSSGCTTSTGTVTCTYGTIANGASADKTFRIPLNLLSLGHVTVTGVRTASAPTDTNPANNSDSATCTVISIILATCP